MSESKASSASSGTPLPAPATDTLKRHRERLHDRYGGRKWGPLDRVPGASNLNALVVGGRRKFCAAPNTGEDRRRALRTGDAAPPRAENQSNFSPRTPKHHGKPRSTRDQRTRRSTRSRTQRNLQNLHPRFNPGGASIHSSTTSKAVFGRQNDPAAAGGSLCDCRLRDPCDLLSFRRKFRSARRHVPFCCPLEDRLARCRLHRRCVVRNVYARTSFAAGEIARSAELFRKAAAVRREDFQSALLAAQSLRMVDRDDEARELRREGISRAERALELNPTDARALSLLPGYLLEEGQAEHDSLRHEPRFQRLLARLK